MKEKILAFLVINLVGVQKTQLDGIAEHYAKNITDESKIEETFNEGVLSALKMSAEVTTRESDRRATEATNTAITNYEAKHKLKDGKVIKVEGGTNPNSITDPTTEDVPVWAKQMIDSNKALSEKISVLEQEKVITGKQEQATTAINASKLPDHLKTRWSGRVNVDSDKPVVEQVQELETEYNELHTSIIGAGSGKGLPLGSGGSVEVSDAEVQEVLDKL